MLAYKQLSLLLFTLNLSGSSILALDCYKKFRSSCPQSTFQTPEGNRWACPPAWTIGSFSSIRFYDNLRAINTTNLTAQVKIDKNINKTSIELCSFSTTDAGQMDWRPIWPSGGIGYCVPSPANKPCTNVMFSFKTTISAPGRNFSCTGDVPMSKCGYETFQIHACCPEKLPPEYINDYLRAPMFNTTFYLLRTSPTCPRFYSFLSTEETIELDNATASTDYTLKDFATDDRGNLTLHFCRYTPVFCDQRNLISPYEMSNSKGPCEQIYTIGCSIPLYPIQPKNDPSKFSYTEYCNPYSKKYESEHFCGAQCPELSQKSIQNGTLSSTSNATYTEVKVTCSDGFYVNGTGQTTCQRNGTWSQDISNTTCSFAQCKEDDLKVGADTIREYENDGSTHPYYFGHNVTFRCKSFDTYCTHFEDYSSNKTVTCLSTGLWSEIPICLRSDNCTNPGNTDTAVINSTIPEFTCHKTATYTCKDHHTTKHPDKLSIVCNPDGKWSRDPPTCEVVFCDTRNDTRLVNGEVISPQHPRYNDTTMFIVNDTLIYECDKGYRLEGDSIITCGADGTWNSTSPNKCTKIICPIATVNITHGYREDNHTDKTVYYEGDQVEYTCDEDKYELNCGNCESSICNSSSQWEPPLPTACVLVYCLPPGIPYSIVNVSKDLYEYHEDIKVECHKTRHYMPTQELTCSENGAWKVKSGDALITCNGSPVTDHPEHNIKEHKWTFVGVGVAFIVVLIAVLLVFGIRRRKRNMIPKAGMFLNNPSYRPPASELRGHMNPNFEDSEPHSFALNPKTSRLVLHNEDTYDVPQPSRRLQSSANSESSEISAGNTYDTLNRIQKSKLNSVSEPEKGTYNTLRKMKPMTYLDTEQEEIYNIPSRNSSTSANDTIHAIRSSGTITKSSIKITSPLQEEQDDEIYNVPTRGRNKPPMIQISDEEFQLRTTQEINDIEFNGLYSNMAAAEICGSPIETDFDNIIYDNI